LNINKNEINIEELAIHRILSKEDRYNILHKNKKFCDQIYLTQSRKSDRLIGINLSDEFFLQIGNCSMLLEVFCFHFDLPLLD